MKPYTYGTKVKVAGRLGEWRVVRVKRTVQVEYRVKRIGKRFTEWVDKEDVKKCVERRRQRRWERCMWIDENMTEHLARRERGEHREIWWGPYRWYGESSELLSGDPGDRDYECVLEQNWAIMKKYAEVPV